MNICVRKFYVAAALWGLVSVSFAQDFRVQREQSPALQPRLDYPLAMLELEVAADLNEIDAYSENSDLTSAPDMQNFSKRSVLRAALYSAVIPGTGEFYNQSYLKGAIFLGVEAAAWILHASFNSKGNDKTEIFEEFADMHWNPDEYWQSIADASGCSVNDRQCLQDYERANFSHFLPDSRNQTYYENVGKYDQFNAGWDDSKTGDLGQRDSENRAHYMTVLRPDANDQFKRATLFASVAMLNHLVSAFDAAISAHRHNQQIDAQVGLRMERYEQEFVPTLSANIQW